MKFFQKRRTDGLLNNIDLDDIKKQEILETIRTAKIQRTIAILTAIGTVIGFIIINLPKIQALLLPKPEVSVHIEDQFLLREGNITISKIEGNEKKKVISYPAKEASEWIALDFGSYTMMLQYQDQEIWSTDFLLNSRKPKVLYVPSQFKENIKVSVVNKTPTVVPGARLDFKIDVTGNGYLWIYELTKEQHYARIYPPTNSSASYNNAITVDKSYVFPNNLALYASLQEGEQTLLFAVTSELNGDFADQITKLMTRVILKTDVRERENNWGIYKITYHVKKP